MSALGQKRTLELNGAMSALCPEADISSVSMGGRLQDIVKYPTVVELSQAAGLRATEARRWSGNRPGGPQKDRDAPGG